MTDPFQGVVYTLDAQGNLGWWKMNGADWAPQSRDDYPHGIAARKPVRGIRIGAPLFLVTDGKVLGPKTSQMTAHRIWAPESGRNDLRFRRRRHDVCRARDSPGGRRRRLCNRWPVQPPLVQELGRRRRLNLERGQFGKRDLARIFANLERNADPRRRWGDSTSMTGEVISLVFAGLRKQRLAAARPATRSKMQVMSGLPLSQARGRWCGRRQTVSSTCSRVRRSRSTSSR